MARIFFGVSGEGMGHATRSLPIIQHLIKKHRLHIFAGSRARKYLAKQFPMHRISSLHIHYANNSVHDTGTVLWNLARIPLYVWSAIKMFVLALYHAPKIIITDFEPFTSWCGALLNIPVISIANIQFVTHTAQQVPAVYRFDSLKTSIITKLMTPVADVYLIPTVARLPCRKNAVLVDPPLRTGILSIKPASGKHLLVYQTSKTSRHILPLLRAAKHPCIVYGFGKNEVRRNLHFKTFSEKEFYHDLVGAKAVITNGGFTLISEALYLKKPLFMIPVRKQYEQIANALEVERLGFGKMAEFPESKDIVSFLKKIEMHRKALRNYPRQRNKETLSILDSWIRKLAP